jgi:hypothetical protein
MKILCDISILNIIFLEDPLKMMLKDGGNKKLPIYSNANITKNIDASQLVSGIRVVNVITGKKGRRDN